MEVYLARDTRLERDVAIKVLAADTLADATEPDEVGMDWLEKAYDDRILFLANVGRERAAGFDLRPLPISRPPSAPRPVSRSPESRLGRAGLSYGIAVAPAAPIAGENPHTWY